MTRIGAIFLGFSLLLGALPARAGEATVAVAANFLTTAETLAELFEYKTGDQILLAHGSTGRLYAQILNGAPYDLFLSADAERPDLLVAEGVATDRMTYALGQMVLVSRDALGDDLGAALAGRRIALADPAVAPYGVAAMEVLGAAELPPDDPGLVFGDSVGQTAALFATGNAEAAFVAQSQVPLLDDGTEVRALEGLYTPIRQDAVLLARGRENTAAAAFFAFLAGDEATAAIRTAGYGVPE